MIILVSILTDPFFLQENAHFYVADMIISVIEKMKCNILSQQHTETWSVREASRSLGNDQVDSEVTFFSNIKQESGSSTSSDSGYEGEWGFMLSSPHPSPRENPLSKAAAAAASFFFFFFFFFSFGWHLRLRFS